VIERVLMRLFDDALRLRRWRAILGLASGIRGSRTNTDSMTACADHHVSEVDGGLPRLALAARSAWSFSRAAAQCAARFHAGRPVVSDPPVLVSDDRKPSGVRGPATPMRRRHGDRCGRTCPRRRYLITSVSAVDRPRPD